MPRGAPRPPWRPWPRLARGALRPEDRDHPSFEEGVACHHCVDETTEADKGRFRERQKQIALAKKRGPHHIGGLG